MSRSVEEEIPGPSIRIVQRDGRETAEIVNWKDGRRWLERQRRRMMSKSVLEVGDEKAGAVAKAPRVALADIKAAIDKVYYFTADKALEGAGYSDYPDSISAFTFCVIIMKNGWVATGTSAPASPENFNEELGKELAYNKAVGEIWALMGFSLRDRLAKTEA